MAKYKPGQGLNKDAITRLQQRKAKDEGIGDVPAAETNEQWSKVLGGQSGFQKKLRCGACTRPLSEADIAAQAIVCERCRNAEQASSDSFTLPVLPVDVELSTQILYYCLRVSPPPSQKPLDRDTSVKSNSGNHVPEQVNNTTTASKKAPQPATSQVTTERITRGSPICTSSLRKKIPKGHAHLAVVSFNVLADCYVRVPDQPWNAFEYVDDKDLPWLNRVPRIIELLLSSDADVMCLQEVALEKRSINGGPEQWALPEWTDQLVGYTGVLQGLKPKEWDNNAQRNQRLVGRPTPTGVASFYKTEHFEERSPSKHGSGSGTTLFLKSKPSDAGQAALEVAIANIHLVGDPAKFDQHLSALKGLKKNVGEKGLRVVCGDFNGECEPDSDVAKWFSEEGFEEVATGTSWAAPGNAQRLDHIFISGGHSGFQTVAANADLSAEEVASGLPCVSCPSDHAPVAALLSAPMKEKCPW